MKIAEIQESHDDDDDAISWLPNLSWWIDRHQPASWPSKNKTERQMIAEFTLIHEF